MQQPSSLILLAALVGCGGSASDATVDAGPDPSGDVDTDGVDPVGPDLACVAPPPQMVAVDPMTLGGTVVALTLTGIAPVADAEVKLFRAGQPIVLARTQSTGNGAYSTGAFPTSGNPQHAYLKAMKPDYRTTFFYPPSPFAKNLTNLPVPMISTALFAQVKSLLGATQNDNKNGALLIGVSDCNGLPVAGATVTAVHGNSPTGQAYDLSALSPSHTGVYVVFNVPDGKVRVSASLNGAVFPSHDVMVRAKDPDCEDARGTVTATTIVP